MKVKKPSKRPTSGRTGASSQDDFMDYCTSDPLCEEAVMSCMMDCINSDPFSCISLGALASLLKRSGIQSADFVFLWQGATQRDPDRLSLAIELAGQMPAENVHEMCWGTPEKLQSLIDAARRHIIAAVRQCDIEPVTQVKEFPEMHDVIARLKQKIPGYTFWSGIMVGHDKILEAYLHAAKVTEFAEPGSRSSSDRFWLYCWKDTNPESVENLGT